VPVGKGGLAGSAAAATGIFEGFQKFARRGNNIISHFAMIANCIYKEQNR